ncbi:UNVERIFIED_CONTAM: IS30 family transposase [Paenibacillus sp. PvR008]
MGRHHATICREIRRNAEQVHRVLENHLSLDL